MLHDNSSHAVHTQIGQDQEFKSDVSADGTFISNSTFAQPKVIQYNRFSLVLCYFVISSSLDIYFSLVEDSELHKKDVASAVSTLSTFLLSDTSIIFILIR